PGQGLRVDARSDDEDRPGQPDVERGGAKPAGRMAMVAPVAAQGEAAARRIAERLDPAQHAALRLDADADPRPDIPDHARQRAVQRFLVIAAGDRPVAAMLVQELARP